MATLVFAGLGALIGGRVGSQIGAFIGQQVDAELFKGPAREGPRLKELEVQTSSYGTQIPAIYGSMRGAGTVIWATDLIERSNKNGGGKGRPSTIEYSYSVSMAVALSSRPAARLGRIWADGNLLRGAAGDLKTGGEMRFYQGHYDQPADPLIASIEGAGTCPAYRGLCYAVFEDLQLADFGNRIPSMTFEIFERDGSVSLCDIVASTAGETIDCEADEFVSGYALLGGDKRSALEPLTDNLPVNVRPMGDTLTIKAWGAGKPGRAVTIASHENSKKLKRPEQTAALQPAAQALAVRYYDPARDYQIGVQQSRLSDIGRVAQQIDLPAALSSAAARRLADMQLLYRKSARSGWSGYIMRDEKRIGAGDIIFDDAEGNPGGRSWQVTEVEHFGMVSRLSARRTISLSPAPSNEADGGRNVTTPDYVIGPTFLMLAELPALRSSDGGAPLVVAAASGTSPGWRRAILSRIVGSSVEQVGSTANAAAIAVLTGNTASHPAHVTDTANAIIVQMVNPQAELPQRETGLADLTAPIFWLDGEIIRAGKIDDLGGGQFRLAQLQRGCFGTESEIAAHQSGRPILLLNPDNLAQLNMDGISSGVQIEIEAMGLGDEQPVAASLNVSGKAIRPFAPVHGHVVKLADGHVSLSWIRRSRIDHGWQDSVDHPLDEDSEAYYVTAYDGEEPLAIFETSGPELLLSPAQLNSWIAKGTRAVTFEISQIGRFAKSPALSLTIVI
ncbi:phage tail protein [Sphingorhabdus arenilitoris]|uniref:Phage tail protein n=1 Tax=Sphingorhabdus arenilitoris TaxID=1490041 RepID=A0ABV8RE68_9SPHN